MLSRYPGHGVGFKVYRKWWPQGMFYHVRDVHLLSPRHGRILGIKYKDSQIAGNKIEKIDDVLKRGMWNYELADSAFTQQQVILDNGVSLNLAETQRLIDEKKAFLSQRTKQMQWIGEPEPELDDAALAKIAKKEAEKAKAKGAKGKKK